MAHKQGTLNRARMLEHRIQHNAWIFVLIKVKPIYKYPTKRYAQLNINIQKLTHQIIIS